MDNRTLNFLLLTMAGIMGFLLALRLGLIGKALWMYWSNPHGTISNASHLGSAPPIEAKPVIADLHALGFRRLGETQVQTSSAKVPITSWLFGESEGVVYAELVSGLPLIGLTTMFSDEAVIQTLYPTGEKINTPDYVCSAVSGSLESAYQYHCRQVQKLGARHGQVRLVKDMNHYLDVASIYRTRYGQYLQRAFLKRQFIALITNLYGLVVPLSAMVMRRVTNISPDPIFIGTLILVLLSFFVKRDWFLGVPDQNAII